MTSTYRYILEKGSKKHNCPECERKSLVRYLDTEEGDYLPEKYGRCDRECKCTYHLNPYKDGYSKKIWEQEHGQQSDWKAHRPKRIKKQTQKTVFIPVEVFNQTRAGYEKNIFIQNLLSSVAFPFEVKDIERVVSHYHLGTVQNGYRTGANTFPFIDVGGNVRAIQAKQFDKTNHTTGTDFLHSIIEKHYTLNNKRIPEWLEAYNKNDKKVSCLFGEHWLGKRPHNPIALVESPKSAIYGTLYFGFPDQPQDLLWLAVYNKSSFSFDKLKVLKGRDVYIFPDLSKDGGTFMEWKRKAEEYEKRLPGTRFVISNLLEQLADEDERHSGDDLADYLIKLDWRKFKRRNLHEQSTPVISSIREKCEKCEKCEPLKKTFFSQSNETTKEFASTAFVNKMGQLYIETPFANTYTIYPSVEDYNNRKTLPDFINKTLIDISGYKPVKIDINTLTINLN